VHGPLKPVTIIGACLLAVLLVVAGLTAVRRTRIGPSSPASSPKPDDRARQVRRNKRAQSKHDRHKH
jgi:hypothetical protein